MRFYIHRWSPLYDLRLLKTVALHGLSTWKILSEEPSICSPPLNYPPPLKVVGVEWVLILTPKVVEKRFHGLINSACTIPVQLDKIIKGDPDVFYLTKKKISKPLPFRPVSVPTTTVTVPTTSTTASTASTTISSSTSSPAVISSVTHPSALLSTSISTGVATLLSNTSPIFPVAVPSPSTKRSFEIAIGNNDSNCAIAGRNHPVASDEMKSHDNSNKSAEKLALKVTPTVEKKILNSAAECVTSKIMTPVLGKSMTPNLLQIDVTPSYTLDLIKSPARAIERSSNLTLSSDFISPPDDSHLGVGFNRPSAILAPPLSLRMTPDKSGGNTGVVDLTRRSPRIIQLSSAEKKVSSPFTQKTIKRAASSSEATIAPVLSPSVSITIEKGTMKRNLIEVIDAGTGINNGQSSSSDSGSSIIRPAGKKAKVVPALPVKGLKAAKAPVSSAKESNGSGNIMNFFVSKK